MEKAIADSAAKYSNIYPATVFMSPGDNKTYNKLADTIFVENTNFCPVIKIPIPDTSAQVGISFNFKIPAGSIKEANPFDQIEYIAALRNGRELPGWLKFNSTSRTFTGTPDSIENLTIRITAVDNFFANVSDLFIITVSSIVGVDNKPDKGITIFPNPTTGLVNISFGNTVKKGKVEIHNLQGTLKFSKTYQNTPSATIDLTGYPKGILLIKTKSNDQINCQKIYLK